jgi:DNA-binding transcriptional LysR family regulator
VRPLDLRALQVFVAVCDAGNMTTAAKALGITQSAVSQHIQQLEEYVGTRLLDRTMRPIRPTPAGSVLAERGRTMLAEAMTTTAIVRRVGSEVLSELRVGIIASLSKTFLTQFAGMVSDHSGQPNLAIWSGLETEHCEALLERKLDIIISANPMLDAANLERHELLTEKFVIIVPREFAERVPDITIGLLCESLPLVRFSARTLSGVTIEQYLRRSRNAPRAHLEFDVPGAIVESVSGGRGWAIINPLDLLFASDGMLTEFVKLMPLRSPSLEQKLFLISRKDEYGKTPAHFADIARGILQDHYVGRIGQIEAWLAQCVSVKPRSAGAV